jgi:hypothetical protein
MDEPLSVQKTVGRSARTGHNGRFGDERCVALWDASQRDGDVAIPFEHPQAAKGRFTKVHRLFEHCLEHRRKDARRRIDDLQHLRGRGLLLERLGELAPACFELLLRIGTGLMLPTSVRSRLRPG